MSFIAAGTNSVGMAQPSVSTLTGHYPQTQYSSPDGAHFHVETVENGYIVRFGLVEGHRFKTYVCKTPQEVSDQILASMVLAKMENS